MPAFDYKGPLVGIAAFKQHCALGFWKASLLNDPSGSLQTKERTAMGNFGCIRTLADLPSEAVLTRLIKAAAKLNDDGIKVTRVVRAKPPIPAPPEFTRALRAAPEAQAAFVAMAPGHQREYLEWITEAKRPETRAKRIVTAIEWITAGKSRHWKYQRK